MKGLVKTYLMAILAVVMMLSFSLVIGVSVVKAAPTEVENLLSQTEFIMAEDTEVRMGVVFDQDGNPSITPEDKNGIRFTAKMDATVYNEVKGNVIFGMLLMPSGYLNGATTLNASEVFTNEGVMVNGQNVAYYERNELTESEDGTYYYMQFSLVDLNDINKDREYISIPYLKASEEDGSIKYEIKGFDIDFARSMVYTAQIELEKEETAEVVKNALQANYIDGFETQVEVVYAVSYDGEDRTSQTTTLTFGVGEVVESKNITDKLAETVGDGVEHAYTYFMLDETNQGEAKIYANGRTKAQIIAEYNVNEDENAYEKSVGYYVADGDSIVLKSDKKVIGNADYANGSTQIEGTYKVYADGKVKIDYNNQKQLLDALGEDIKIGETLYQESIAAPAKVNEKIRGYYENGTDFVVVQDNGTLSKNLVDTGYYGIYFDKATQGFRFYSFMLNEDAIESEIDLSASSYTIKIGETDFTLSTTNRMASKEQYLAFANAYTGSYYYPLRNWDNVTSLSAVKTPDTTLTFDANGIAIYDGIELYRRATRFNCGSETSRILGQIRGQKECQYVLFDNNDFKIYMRDVAGLNESNFYSAYEPMMVDGTFDSELSKITLKYGSYKDYLPEFELTATGTSNASVDSVETTSVDVSKVYTDISKVASGAQLVFTEEYTNKFYGWGTNKAGWSFKEDGTFSMQNPASYLYGTYVLTPINENYGKISLVVDRSTNNNFYVHSGEGYYSYINDAYTISMHFDIAAVGEYVYMRQWFAVGQDSTGRPSSYDTKKAYEALLGAGTVDAPATKTLVGNGKDLVLQNDGSLVIETEGGTARRLGKGTYDGNALTYSLVPTSTTQGLIFMHMAEAPVFNAEEASTIVKGTYVIDGSYITIICDLGVFVTKGVNLYDEYAGTYNASYTYNSTSYSMTLILNADGTFTGTGTGSASSMTIRDSKVSYYSRTLGVDDRTGNYSFEIIGGEIKVIFDFNINTEATPFAGITGKSGYRSVVNYNGGGYTAGDLSTELTKNGGVSGYGDIGVFDVYDYASGTLGSNSMNVLFEGFASTPIKLTKTV